ncbi:transposase [Desulfobulbus sp. F3]|nr:transposase [Desulfobulbus sp. F3]
MFDFWLEHPLLPEIPKNSLAVLGNASFHKSEKINGLVKKFSCGLLFLPPYSPDLNPTEKFWASLTAKIKKVSDGIKSLSACIEAVFKTI